MKALAEPNQKLEDDAVEHSQRQTRKAKRRLMLVSPGRKKVAHLAQSSVSGSVT